MADEVKPDKKPKEKKVKKPKPVSKNRKLVWANRGMTIGAVALAVGMLVTAGWHINTTLALASSTETGQVARAEAVRTDLLEQLVTQNKEKMSDAKKLPAEIANPFVREPLPPPPSAAAPTTGGARPNASAQQ